MMGVAGFESLYTSASEEEGESLYWGPSTVDTYLQGQGQVSMSQGMSRCVCLPAQFKSRWWWWFVTLRLWIVSE